MRPHELDPPQYPHTGTHLPHAGPRPAPLHSGVLAQGHCVPDLHRGQRLGRRGWLPGAAAQSGERARAAARPDRRQAAPVRHAHPDLLAHAAPHDSGRLPDTVVGQLARVGGAAPRRARAPHHGIPLLRETARRGDPGDGGGEAQGGGPERVHRSDAVLVRLEGRTRRPSVGGVVSQLLGQVSRRGRGRDARGRNPAHRVLAGRIPVSLSHAAQGRVKLEVVTIGTELLLGHTVDTNAAELGRALAAAGAEITRHTTVADRPDAIRAAVAEALARSGFVITTGGLGPTRDDMTKTVVAQLLGKRLLLDERLLASIKARFDRMGRPMPAVNRTQAEVPEGAVILPNPRGTAPGLWVEDPGGRVVVLLPGVPREMHGLLAEQVLPRIVARQGSARRVVVSRTVRTTGTSESALAERIGPIEPEIAPLTLAYLPSVDGVDLRVTAWELEPEDAEARLAAVVERLKAAVGEHGYGEDDADLAAVLLDALRKGRHRLGVAESCTGGMIGERITNIPGASDTFIGGVVAYADVIKTAALKVPLETLEAYGAVSEETVRAMADGAQRLFSADCTIAVTGIAGPGGGTPEKPVGTVWLAARVHTTTRALTRVLPGDLEAFRRVARLRTDRPQLLLGTSFGGLVALRYLETQPSDPIAGAVVVSPWLGLAFRPPAWKRLVGRVFADLWPTLPVPARLDADTLSRDPVLNEAYAADPAVHCLMTPGEIGRA